MAGSNMEFSSKSYAGDVQILKRLTAQQSIPMTLDFTAVSDLYNGVKIVKAGTPIGAAGTVDNTATVVGILLHDVLETRPQGALIQDNAWINKAVAEAHSGVTYDADMMAALSNVHFE